MKRARFWMVVGYSQIVLQSLVVLYAIWMWRTDGVPARIQAAMVCLGMHTVLLMFLTTRFRWPQRQPRLLDRLEVEEAVRTPLSWGHRALMMLAIAGIMFLLLACIQGVVRLYEHYRMARAFLPEWSQSLSLEEFWIYGVIATVQVLLVLNSGLSIVRFGLELRQTP